MISRQMKKKLDRWVIKTSEGKYLVLRQSTTYPTWYLTKNKQSAALFETEDKAILWMYYMKQHSIACEKVKL